VSSFFHEGDRHKVPSSPPPHPLSLQTLLLPIVIVKVHYIRYIGAEEKPPPPTRVFKLCCIVSQEPFHTDICLQSGRGGGFIGIKAHTSWHLLCSLGWNKFGKEATCHCTRNHTLHFSHMCLLSARYVRSFAILLQTLVYFSLFAMLSVLFFAYVYPQYMRYI
jgi:hypothetical protein